MRSLRRHKVLAQRLSSGECCGYGVWKCMITVVFFLRKGRRKKRAGGARGRPSWTGTRSRPLSRRPVAPFIRDANSPLLTHFLFCCLRSCSPGARTQARHCIQRPSRFCEGRAAFRSTQSCRFWKPSCSSSFCQFQKPNAVPAFPSLKGSHRYLSPRTSATTNFTGRAGPHR